MTYGGFRQWFEVQFGPRPSTEAVNTLLDRAEAIGQQHRAAVRLATDTARWELRRETALKAWEAARGGHQ